MASVICGLYTGGETISLLALQPSKKGWTVHGGASEFHALGENDDPSPLIKAMARPLKLGKAEATAVLPKKQGILRNVILPSTDAAELVQMARFEAERHIPFHAERHSTGYHVMRSLGLEGSEVLLGAVDSPIVQRQLDGLIAAGLTPKAATLSSVALMNTVLFSRREWLKGKTVAVLSLGLDSLDLVFVSDGRILFARSVSLDLRGVLEKWAGHASSPETMGPRPDMSRLALAARMIDCTDLEGNYGGGGGGAESPEVAGLVRTWIDRVMQEMRRTYDFARREMKCPPVEAVALTGEGAILRNLAQYLYVNLNVEVQTVNPLDGLPRAKGVRFPFDGYEFAIAFGGAIAGQLEGAYRIDLTPHEHYRQLAKRRLIRQLITTGVMLTITLGLGIAALMRQQSIDRQTAEAYSKINEKLGPKVAMLRERETKLKIINMFINDDNSALNVLDAIARSRTIPQRVTLTMVGYTKSGQDEHGMVELEGDGKTLPDINGFVGDLRTTGRFTDVQQPQDPSPSQVNQQGMYSFRLECPLVGSGKGNTGEGGAQ